MADLKIEVDYRELTGLIKTTDQTKQSVRALAQQFARSNDSAGYMRGINQIVNAQKRLSVESRMSRSEIMRLGQRYRQQTQFTDELARAQRNLAVAQQGSTRAMGRGQVITQQAGYQIGDFIVQVQSGTNAFVAFGQQATQVAGTLTLLGGKMVLIGTVLGIAIPLLTAVGAAFMRTRQDADEAADGVETLEDQLKSLDDTLKDYLTTREAARSGITTEELLGLGGLEEAEENLQSLREEVERLRRAGQASIITGGGGFGFFSRRNAEELEEAIGRLIEAENRLAILREQQGREQFQTFSERLTQYQEEIELQRTIARLGESSEEARRVRSEQALAAELRRIEALREGQEITDAQAVALSRLAESAMATAEEAERASEEATRLAEELDISVGQAQALAGIGFGNIWDGANGASQLASNLALANRMAANYEGRESAYEGVRVGGPPIMTSDGIEVRPQTLAPGLDPFAGMEGSDLIPTVRGGRSGGGGGGGGRSLQEIIEERQRLIEQEIELARLSDETRRVREIALEIENAYGEEVSATQAAAIQSAAEQIATSERVIEQLERQRQMQEQIAEIIGNSFGDAFTSIIDGTKSAEEAFRDMMNSIIQELFRLLVVQPIINSITGALGGGGGGLLGGLFGNLAEGGTMYPNRPYLVGEHGPEIVIPGRQSSVKNTNLSRNMMGGGQTVDVRVYVDDNGNFDAKVERISQNAIEQAAPSIVKASEQTILNNRKRGGNYRSVFG